MNETNNAVTNKAFWDEFWDGVTIPVQYNPSFNNDHAIAEIIMRYAPNGQSFSKTAIEIGCAPGKWMLYLMQQLSYTVHGCEYLSSGIQKTEQNFAYFNIDSSRYRLFQGDFFDLDLPPDYDLVLSLGFVEHFKNFNHVMERHLSLLKRGGLLIIGLPRFRGVNWLIQSIIDRNTVDKAKRYLPVHNLQIMNRGVFARFAAQHRCETLFNGFVGGFEHALFPVYNVPSERKRNILNNWISTFSEWKFLQSAWYGASYQMCVLRKEI